jgi:hypothetical protein
MPAQRLDFAFSTYGRKPVGKKQLKRELRFSRFPSRPSLATS